MEVKVLHEGCLEKCSTADEQVKKEWKKRYFVFKHFPTSSTKCLEYYKDKNWRKQDAKGVLTLHPGYEVLKVADSKRKFMFDVRTVEHVFRLSAQTEDDLNKWILILEKENVVKSFVVEPVLDSTMARIGAPSTCHLFIADAEIRLVSAQDGSQLIAWPFTCLRRYMSSRGKFSLEAGRRAPTGEGKFMFITSQHDEIYKLLDNVIKSRAGSTGGQTSSSRLSDIPIQAFQDDSYDHLMSPNLKGVAPVHANHPNYDQNVFSQKSDSLKSNDYASPYGHMKKHESISSQRGESNSIQSCDGKQDGYDTLSHQSVDAQQNNKVPLDGYDILNPTKPTRKPPPAPQINKATDQHTEDFYNTIDTECKTSADKGENIPDDNTYDSLDHQQGSVTKQGRLSFTSAYDHTSQGSFDGDTYNVLAHVGSPVSSPSSIGGEEYSTFGRTPSHPSLRQTKSFPIPPPRTQSTASEGYDRSSISSLSSFGSCELSSGYRGSLSSPQSDEQDFYSSIENDNITSKQGIPKPALKPKPKDTDTDKGKRSLVSNLRASLIADGLNLNKVSSGKLGIRRHSVDTIEESDTYDHINEGATKDQRRIPNKPLRSPSAPIEPEDIYEDPDIQLQEIKPKVKPVKPSKRR